MKYFTATEALPQAHGSHERTVMTISCIHVALDAIIRSPTLGAQGILSALMVGERGDSVYPLCTVDLWGTEFSQASAEMILTSGELAQRRNNVCTYMYKPRPVPIMPADAPKARKQQKTVIAQAKVALTKAIASGDVNVTKAAEEEVASAVSKLAKLLSGPPPESAPPFSFDPVNQSSAGGVVLELQFMAPSTRLIGDICLALGAERCVPPSQRHLRSEPEKTAESDEREPIPSAVAAADAKIREFTRRTGWLCDWGESTYGLSTQGMYDKDAHKLVEENCLLTFYRDVSFLFR